MSLLRRINDSSGGQKDSNANKPAPGNPPPSPAPGGGSGGLSQQEMERRRPVNPARVGKRAQGENYTDIKSRIQGKLVTAIDTLDINDKDEIQRQAYENFTTILQEEGLLLPKPERERLFQQVIADIIGLGPLDPLLQDDTITEIMVNGPKNVFVERKGKVMPAPVTFDDDNHVKRIIDRIVAPLGRRVDETSPMVDARLPDGSRVNVVIRPIALCGPTITIRKFSKTPLGVEDLIRFGSMTKEIAEFMRACVVSRLNMIISGGTGSGKTTLLNVLSSFIPNDERILTIENAAELQLQQEHVVSLESRPPNIEGKGEVTIQDLVVNSLRMRPERIVVGECRSKEALDMLQAMNTGHDGSLTTLHANTPRDAISRLEVMCLMAGMDLPPRAIREQVASAVDVIVQQQRLSDGSRKITNITEVQGMEGEMITMSDIFEFEQTGLNKDQNGKEVIVGRIKPTGMRPRFESRLEDHGFHLPASVFGVGQRR